MTREAGMPVARGEGRQDGKRTQKTGDMTKFCNVKKSALTNGQHFSYMDAFVKELRTLADVPARLAAAVAEMAAALETEKRQFGRERRSRYTAGIRDADRLRDRCYRALHAIAKAWLASPDETRAAAARAVWTSMNNRHVRPSGHLDDESGRISVIASELDTPALRVHVATLGVESLVGGMAEANERVKELVCLRGREMMGRETGAMRRARLRCDRAYRAVVEAMEAYNYLQGDYEDFIVAWNFTTVRYREILNRRAGVVRAAREAGQGAKGTDFSTGEGGRGESGTDSSIGGNGQGAKEEGFSAGEDWRGDWVADSSTRGDAFALRWRSAAAGVPGSNPPAGSAVDGVSGSNPSAGPAADG